MSETIKNVENQTEKNASISERFKNIEDSLNIINDDDKVSDDIDETQYKINALKRQWNISKETEIAFNRVLDKHDKLVERQFESSLEYIDATQDLLVDLSELKLKNWKKLKEVTIDWWLFETTIALYEWTKKAWEKIIDEFKQNLKTFVSPDEWMQIVKALWQALIPPIDFIKNILEWIKNHATRIYDYIQMVSENSTKKWFWVEMSKYLPETWLPLLISSVWPWKFFKILKIDKFIPDSVMNLWKKWEKPKESWWEVEKDLVNPLEFRFAANVPIEKARDNIEKVWELLTKEYFTFWFEMSNKALRTLVEMTDYIIKNKDKIKLSKEVKSDMVLNLSRMNRKITTIMDNDNVPMKTKRFLNKVRSKKMVVAYNKINPQKIK